MKIKCVTVSGADDRSSISEMHRMSETYHFVEWGLLVSRYSVGRNRFPTMDWIVDFLEDINSTRSASLHICGRWLLDIGRGDPTTLPSWLMGHAQRIQFNFAHQLHKIHPSSFFALLREYGVDGNSLIFQLDGSNFEILDQALNEGMTASPFYDRSRGNGVLPDSWPKPRPNEFSGYAGGLTVKNLEDQLRKIEDVVGDQEIWIDVESGVRNEHDQWDANLVSEFLEKCRDWVR